MQEIRVLMCFALALDDIRKEGRKEGKRDSTGVTPPFLLESRPCSYWSRSRVSTGVTNEGVGGG